MRHKKKGNPLGLNSAHRKAMLSNLVVSFFEHGKVKTTHDKAKEGQRLAEKLITLGKQNTLHARRQAFRIVKSRDVVKVLFDNIAPQYADRNGGYTRVIKLGNRHGDNALVSLLEMVVAPVATAPVAEVKEAEPTKKKVAKKKVAKKKVAKKKDEKKDA